MNRVFTVGETVFDIIFKNNRPAGATPGGSMMNTSVSLGRLGMNVSFISEYGEDRVGGMVDEFLRENGVDTSHICRYRDCPTSLSLAFLDENSNAAYSFYRKYPQKRLEGIVFPEPSAGDVILFGSFYGIEPGVHAQLMPFLDRAKRNGALIMYDPNFRASHLNELETCLPVIMRNFGYADIIKGSDEDFAYILKTENAEDTWQAVRDKCNFLVYTAGKNEVKVFAYGVRRTYRVPEITPVSTIGAGDTFNAGLIAGLVANNTGKNNLKEMTANQQKAIVENAILFAGHVCTGYDNYLSRDFAREQSEKLKVEADRKKSLARN
jgi:fructokinase